MADETLQPQATPEPVPAPEPAVPGVYKDDDLVYVDPDSRTVVGRVEWSNSGRPKSLPMKEEMVEVEEDDKGPKGKGKGRPPRRQRRQRYYPWGTYRSMKRIYKIEGKQIKEESNKTLDEVIEKALQEPFWD